jgi:hypothetical protein
LAPTIRDEQGLSARLITDNGRRKLQFTCNPPIATRASGGLPDTKLLLTPTGPERDPEPIPADPLSLEQIEQSRLTRRPVSQLIFDVTNVPGGLYRVRLRIDTVETVVMNRDGLKLDFDELQMIQL